VKVVATGPVSSGTRWLYYLIEHWGIDVVHWSQPQWQTFWSHDEWPDDTKFVIILRRPDASTASAFKHGHGQALRERTGFDTWQNTGERAKTSVELMEEWWQEAMRLFADFPPERTLWVSYEALQFNTENQAKAIADFVGSDRHDIGVPAKTDTNARWL
jgi:hypothetical protein